MAREITGGPEGRIGLTLYYGYVCALAVGRCVSTVSGREVVATLSYWQVALYTALALSSWWLLRSFRWKSDRIAALLYGLFYALRIGAYFIKGIDISVLVLAEGTLISAGMVAMIVGLKHAISPDDNPGSTQRSRHS